MAPAAAPKWRTARMRLKDGHVILIKLKKSDITKIRARRKKEKKKTTRRKPVVSESESEPPRPKPKRKKPRPPSDDEDEPEPPRRKKRGKARRDEEDDDDEEDEAPRRKRKMKVRRAHLDDDEDDDEPIVCKFFLEGDCRHGDRCRNSHEITGDKSELKLFRRELPDILDELGQVSIGTVMGCYKSRHGTIDVRQHGFTSLTAFFESMEDICDVVEGRKGKGGKPEMEVAPKGKGQRGGRSPSRDGDSPRKGKGKRDRSPYKGKGK